MNAAAKVPAPSQPHVLVADWIDESALDRESFDRAGITLSAPALGLPEPSCDEQHRQLLAWIAAAPRIDALLFGAAPVDAQVIDALPTTCKLLQRMGIGLDNVDLDRARQRGFVVRNTPNYCVEEVAVHAMAMLLSLHRQLDSTQAILRSGGWTSVTPQPLERLSTLTLGVVGLGRIGRKLAEMMRPMTARVVGHDPAAIGPPDWIEQLSLDDLFRRADLISLHCPLTPQNRQMIDARALALMKPTTILVNVSRERLMDLAALAAALDAGRLAGAGLDICEPELAPIDSPLRRCPNTILTSHTAWFSRQAIVDARTLAVQNILEAIGKKPREQTP
jgi:D-3-phosphoglycerate dehydrogenase / 2-oxoglutarate reductase